MVRALVKADAAFVALWNDGVPTEVMAEHYGVSRATVRNCALRAGLRRRAAAGAIDTTLLAELWDSELPTRAIGKRLGCSAAHVSKCAKVAGLPPRGGPFEVEKLDAARVVEQWFSDLSARELAAALGVSFYRMAEVRDYFHLPKRTTYPAKSPAQRERLHAQYLRDCAARIEAADVVPAPPPVVAVSGSPFWTPARDAMILETGGKYAAINAVATKLRRTSRDVQARWHRLEAAAVRLDARRAV